MKNPEQIALLSGRRPIGPDDTVSRADLGERGYMEPLTSSETTFHFMRYARGRQAQKDLEEGSLQDPEEIEYAKQMFEEGMKSRDELIVRNQRLVLKDLRKYAGHGLPAKDLFQEGTIGVIKAVDRFDWTRGCQFSTYAKWWTNQSMRRAIIDQSEIIRKPEYVFNIIGNLLRIKNKLAQELNREPTLQEIAQLAEMNVQQVKNFLDRSLQPVSLDAVIGEDGSTLGEIIPSEDGDISEISLAQSRNEEIENLLSGLPERDRKVIVLRFGLNGKKPMTLQRTGIELGISRERVRQLETRALDNLRNLPQRNNLRSYIK